MQWIVVEAVLCASQLAKQWCATVMRCAGCQGSLNTSVVPFHSRFLALPHAWLCLQGLVTGKSPLVSCC